MNVTGRKKATSQSGLTKYRLIAFIALRCKLLAEAVRTETFPFLEVEACIVDRLATARARKAFWVPGLVTIQQSSALYHLQRSDRKDRKRIS